MTRLPEAILFHARDFLAEEFARFHKLLPDPERVYVVSKTSEAETVRSIDQAANIFNAAEYIGKASDGPIVDDAVFAAMHQNVQRDRYLRRLDPATVVHVVHGVRAMLDDIGARFRVLLYLDEPVSGFINECLNQWVSMHGGTPAHFQTTWLPGYLFFCSDATQQKPIPLHFLDDAHAIVDAHFAKRLRNEAPPTYLLDYSSRRHTLRQALTFGMKGVYRRIRNAESFLDADPWPHTFQAQALSRSTVARYNTVKSLQAMSGARFVVYPMHYEPEAVITYFSDFTDQLTMVNAVFDNLPAHAYLVLKEHPSQPGAVHHPKWRQLRELERVLVLKGTESMSEILRLDDVTVVSIASNAAIEAAIHARPSFVMGQPHFRDLPGITFVNHRQPFSLLNAREPASREEIVAWYGDFAARHAIQGIFMRGRTNVPEAERLLQTLWDRARMSAGA